MPNIRFWGDEGPAVGNKLGQMRVKSIKEKYAAQIVSGKPIALSYLALSGGGEDGAYGAGLMVGWTQRGDRPSFEVVSGVSTGALMAPFVFLGPKYDPILREFYTTLDGDTLIIEQFFSAIFNGTSLYDTKPLKKLIAKYITRSFLDEVASEYHKGRFLFVSTTNLDEGRSVIWNMGAIASSHDKKALQLFRDVLLASASVPGVFPPALFPVQINGKTYQELHVDGGIAGQVFIAPLQVSTKFVDEKVGVKIKRTLYVIRNTKLTAPYEAVDPDIFDISGRSIAVLIKRQGVADVVNIFGFAQREKLDFRLTYVPDDFDEPLPEPFYQPYMKALFQVGFDRGKTGEGWLSAPPGF